jgi:hypothetical protein
MKSIRLSATFVWLLSALLYGQVQPAASLRGIVTDPSGASVPEALVQLRGPGGEQRARTDTQGRYSFTSLQPGKYLLRVIAKGFTVTQKKDYAIAAPTVLDVQLTIESETQVINVEDEANSVSTDPTSNASALVLGQKELGALSDDPDELEQQLQAMAGPAAGPSGGTIYIDGFSGGTMPPKASIREVRINSNPYAAEFDRPGFGRIEILTRPGSDYIRGQAFLQYNKEALNARSPLLTQSKRPAYQQKQFGFNLSGPLKKSKASFGLDMERRSITENAFVYATTLDSNLNPLAVNQTVLTPQTRTSVSPRLDYAITSSSTLIVRYQYTRSEADKDGVGSYALASRAYDQKSTDQNVQITETSMLSAKSVNETRFQFSRNNTSRNGDNSIPALTVQGAFEGGGAQIGTSGSTLNRWELTNSTTYAAGRHSWKWGARLRQSFTNDTSVSNFGGSYSFFGGSGPQLDASNQAIANTSVDLTALERYRRTLLFQGLGYSPALVRSLGGGASQFAISAGTPTTEVKQFDIGLFAADDWKLRPNLTLSYGLRYEAQTNLGDLGAFAPRIGLAWGIGGGQGKATKTVLRAGFGAFYDRLAESATLASLRYNGVTQQSYLITSPDFYPVIPTVASLASGLQPQQLQVLDNDLKASRTYQSSVGVERQLNKAVKLSVQYINTRGVHLLRSVNVNAPLNGVYPYGDQQLRLDNQSTGFSRSNMLIVSPNVNFKKIFVFGFYGLSYGKSDAEGTAADPYNLRAEWGPSSYTDIRHRFLVGSSLPLPKKFSISPFFVASSGTPYNITTGRDTNGDGFTAERPALRTDLSASQCNTGTLTYKTGFGCFDVNPASGLATIGRNSVRGPGSVTLNLRLSRTWGFGNRHEAAAQDQGPSGPGAGGPPPGGGGPPPGGGGGGPRGGGPGGGGPGGGGPGGMFGGANTGKRYNLTLSVSARNILNHPNWAAPSGDLSSSYFGQSRSLSGFGPFSGNTTYNRKLDIQLRFSF